MSTATPVETADTCKPFGEADCESEIRQLGDDYQKYYFYHTRFNREALAKNVFLIVGRRGSGKTALSRFFSFQTILPNACVIDVDEPKVYQDVLTTLSKSAAATREVAIPRLARIWDFVIWSVIFNELRDEDQRIRDANLFGSEAGKASNFIRHAIRWLLNHFGRTDTQLAAELEDLIASPTFDEGKKAVLEIARRRPVIIAFDTLENYAVHDEDMVRATAALIECAATFCPTYARHNIHLKLFIMAEVFPYLMDEAVPNTLKHIKDEIYLQWRPKDLMRLLSWRFAAFLRSHKLPFPNGVVKDWDDHKEVQERMWTPFFGSTLTNSRGLRERSFPYILRHTQLRPRQLIVLANEIAQHAVDSKNFPRFSEANIRDGIKAAEKRLATEVISAYSSVYPKVGLILDVLTGMPAIFKGSELDKRAHQTASQWPNGDYSPWRFRQILSELGVVGRVRHLDDDAKIAAVDFEYATEGRLPLLDQDMCAIHPMFYDKLRVKSDPPRRVYPFPDHPEFCELNNHNH
jgi:hypothetical protein